MESKKVDNTWKEDNNQQKKHRILLNDLSGRRCCLKSTDLKHKKNNSVSQSSDTGDSNKETKYIKDKNSIASIVSTSTEIAKDSNFEYEEEWDIGGIPELLNDLDADIEKSLKIHHLDGDKNLPVYKKDILKPIKLNEKEKKSNSQRFKNNLNSQDIHNIFNHDRPKSLDSNDLSKSLLSSTSTFAGFSKGGHLISTLSSTHCISPYSTNLGSNCATLSSKSKFDTSKYLENKGCITSMSSQAGNNSNTSSAASGGVTSSTTSGQSASCSSNTIKSNNKMSIDHQATLDKGLKMKIKRTKPGSKSSEAKHEIVKATEQQQNGLVGTGSGACSTNQEENTCPVPASSLAASNSTQSSNSSMGNSNLQSSGNLIGGIRKSVGNSNSQTSNAVASNSNSGNNAPNNGAGTSNSTPQSITQGTKRGSSGHRRDKTKDKSSHSNRTGVGTEKNSLSNEKESADKTTCHCSGADSNTSSCSSNTCIRRTECSTLSQRLSNTIASGSNTVVPPGVFTPSADSPSAAVSAATLLAVTTAVSSTPVVTQSTSSSGSANAPGPPNKEVSSSVSNIKISSHIAAQLAAAAASNNSTSGSSVSTLSNTDIKLSPSNVTNQMSKQLAPGIISATFHHTLSVPVSTNTSSLSGTISTPSQIDTGNSTSDENSASPPAKRAKHMDCNMKEGATNMNNKEMVDICIGTSVGTITEPDCLGPCEPGTSVTLEGIVWHETEGGVLVVNVTWRGKTYVGTLLDCTRHDWAPPRFCDSPTEDLDSRTPKGRGKRGRAAITPDLSNFTETRSSIYFSHSHVHSKLRNGSTKGGRATSRTSSATAVEKTNSGSSLSSGNGGSTPSTSPTAFLPPRSEKRKSKDDSPSPVRGDNESMTTNMVNASGIPISASGGGLATQPQSLINPVTGLNVQISTKKCKTSSPCAISPVLLECPEQDCSKKYKHANGLRYHQSHAHGCATLLDEDSMAENEEQLLTPLPSPLSSAPTPSSTIPNPSDVASNTQNTASSKPIEVSDGSDTNVNTSEQDVLSLEIDQVEHSSQTPEVAQSLPCDSLLSLTEKQSNNTISTPTVTTAVGSTTAETSRNGQQKQFVDIVGNKLNINTLLALESNKQPVQQSPSGKSGVLRFGQPQGDEKMDSSGSISDHSITNKQQIEAELSQTSLLESEQNSLPPFTPKNDINTSLQHISNTESYNLGDEASEKPLQQSPNQQSVSGSSQTTSNFIGKQKKIRRSPPPNDYATGEVSFCKVHSREDVQSPAYSDISDDSTPINDQETIDKQQISKNPDIIKKVQDIGLSSGSVCSAGNQHNMTSTLGGYGVYQFYQQQQFMVPPSIEQQQSAKNSLTANNAQSVNPPPGAQQQAQTASELNNKKEPPLDLITKENLSQKHSIQQPQDLNKESNRQLIVGASQGGNDLSSISSMGSTGALAAAPSKPVSHFYAFNYMSPNYAFNVDPNYVPINTTTEDNTKINRHSGILSPNDQHQHPPVLYKDDRSKDALILHDSAKTAHQQIISNKTIKTEPLLKTENIKQETPTTTSSQISQQHIPLHAKDIQGMGVYSNIYQRHPLTLAPQHLSREEELRRYYIFSDQQRRQNNSTQSAINHQGQLSSIQTGHQQCKDDEGLSQQTLQSNHQQQIKIKPNSSFNIMSNSGKSTATKESPKHKQEDEVKLIKQEGQKPTMETQGPPPPPTSQYFLHPSYMASSPFGFDPSHPMYRNVLMPATSPYNTPPYHLPMPRYHAPEDLSRNAGTKALDALHHAANQYYTTHKIHELSERALKSPNSSGSNGASGTIKASVSSPNIGTTQLSNINANIVGHHSGNNQPSGASQLQHNLASQTIGGVTSNKQDITGQKPLVTGNIVQGTSLNEPQKSQTSSNSLIGSNSSSGNASSSGGSVADSRSPPPQRHVHTHHHTHVGLGYPMYPAPYGAAVLASQQAAAVAVINPFPPGPNK